MLIIATTLVVAIYIHNMQVIYLFFILIFFLSLNLILSYLGRKVDAFFVNKMRKKHHKKELNN